MRKENPFAGTEVTLHEDDHDLVVGSYGQITKPKHGCFIGPESVVGEANLQSLASVLRNEKRCCASIPETIMIAKGNGDLMVDDYLFDPHDVELEVGADYIHAKFDILVGPDRLPLERYNEILKPLLKRHDCRIGGVRLVDSQGNDIEDVLREDPGTKKDELRLREEEKGAPRLLSVAIEPMAAMRARVLIQAGHEAKVLLSAIKRGEFNVMTVTSILRARLPNLLIGIKESAWFEAKSQAYPLSAPGETGSAAKIELAQDVARFANGEMEGILVIGLAASKGKDGETVNRVAPVKLNALDTQQYRDVIDSRVHPVLDGLEVERVELGNDRGLLFIRIPVQPEEYKPFLVHGAIVDGRVEGAFISIVRRRGEASIPITASQIHATLAAGRSFLRSV